jgi:hypothetical protein
MRRRYPTCDIMPKYGQWHIWQKKITTNMTREVTYNKTDDPQTNRARRQNGPDERRRSAAGTSQTPQPEDVDGTTQPLRLPRLLPSSLERARRPETLSLIFTAFAFYLWRPTGSLQSGLAMLYSRPVPVLDHSHTVPITNPSSLEAFTR